MKLLDIGNTYTKIYDVKTKKQSVISLEMIPKDIPIYAISSHKNFNNDILASYENITVLNNKSGVVKHIYDEINTLGVDRYMAMNALVGGGKDIAIIDCGSAMTLDIMNSKDEHLGGIISAGLPVLRQSFTDKLPHLKFDNSFNYSSVDMIGTDTATCVSVGMYSSVYASIDFYINTLLPNYNITKDNIYFTGGAIGHFSKVLPDNINIDKNLVFKGMLKCLDLL